MKQGLAIWHYPHRTVEENIAYFAEHGFDSVSLHGAHFYTVTEDAERARKTADLIRKYNLTMTVHSALPKSPEGNADFYRMIDSYAAWQEKYGLISILSFDVPGAVRPHILEYLRYVLAHVPACRVAVEDYGLNEAEAEDVKPLLSEPRFGYLIDIGHMAIRLGGRHISEVGLFNPSPIEGSTGTAKEEDFERALRSKPFPIVEVHFHDNDGENDLHQFLGDGSIDLKGARDALRAIGFDGVLTIESAPGFVFKCYGEDADRGILKTFEYFKSL